MCNVSEAPWLSWGITRQLWEMHGDQNIIYVIKLDIHRSYL